MKKQIDIGKYQDFIDAGFKECSGCGWAFAPAEFDKHNCDDMKKPAHNGHALDDKPCNKDCPAWEEEEQGLECCVCHKIKPDVSIRACAYQAEINNDHEYTEQICDDCEYEHRMDI